MCGAETWCTGFTLRRADSFDVWCASDASQGAALHLPTFYKRLDRKFTTVKSKHGRTALLCRRNRSPCRALRRTACGSGNPVAPSRKRATVSQARRSDRVARTASGSTRRPAERPSPALRGRKQHPFGFRRTLRTVLGNGGIHKAVCPCNIYTAAHKTPPHRIKRRGGMLQFCFLTVRYSSYTRKYGQARTLFVMKEYISSSSRSFVHT